MVFLEEKKKKGRIYWYATEKNGHRSGEANMVGVRETVEGSAALPAISDELNFVEAVNKHTNKKKTFGLTVGEYLLLNIIGRCDGAISENAMQKWFESRAHQSAPIPSPNHPALKPQDISPHARNIQP